MSLPATKPLECPASPLELDVVIVGVVDKW
jgi:hypothetical protein